MGAHGKERGLPRTYPPIRARAFWSASRGLADGPKWSVFKELILPQLAEARTPVQTFAPSFLRPLSQRAACCPGRGSSRRCCHSLLPDKPAAEPQ